MITITNYVKTMHEQEHIVVKYFLADLANIQLFTSEALPSLGEIYSRLLRVCKDNNKEHRVTLNETVALVSTNSKINCNHSIEGGGKEVVKIESLVVLVVVIIVRARTCKKQLLEIKRQTSKLHKSDFYEKICQCCYSVWSLTTPSHFFWN